MSKKYHNNKYRRNSGPGDGPGEGYPMYGYPGTYGNRPYEDDPEDEIDLIELAKIFWNDRYVIAKIAGVCVILGLFIALFSSIEYQTDAVLLPETQSSQTKAGNLLDKYGGLLGISGGSAARQQSTLPPQLYPQIVKSMPFQVELMSRPIQFSAYDTTATSYEFWRHIYSPSLVSYISTYTIGLPGQIIGLFRADDKKTVQEGAGSDVTDRDSVYTLSKAQWATINTLRERVTIQIDQDTGVLTLNASMPDPQAAAEIARAAIRILKEHVRDYRTQSAKRDLEFIQAQAGSAGKKFKEAQRKLANFRDSNIDVTSARARSQEQELQSEYDLNFNTYNSLRQQLERAKLKVQEQTPVLSVLQPVTVPLKKSSPKRMLILIISLIVGLIIGFGWSLLHGWGREIIDEIRAGDTPAVQKEKDQIHFTENG